MDDKTKELKQLSDAERDRNYEKINKEIEAWPSWKKEAYNNLFVSNNVGKLNLN